MIKNMLNSGIPSIIPEDVNICMKNLDFYANIGEGEKICINGNSKWKVGRYDFLNKMVRYYIGQKIEEQIKTIETDISKSIEILKTIKNEIFFKQYLDLFKSCSDGLERLCTTYKQEKRNLVVLEAIISRMHDETKKL